MKTIVQLIKSFQEKASMDEYAIVSRNDLQAAINYLSQVAERSDTVSKMSLNSGN